MSLGFTEIILIALFILIVFGGGGMGLVFGHRV